jgi:hypothetical protein
MGATLRSGDMTLTVPPMTFVTTTLFSLKNGW